MPELEERPVVQREVVERKSGSGGIIFTILGIILLVVIVLLLIQYLPSGESATPDAEINVEAPVPTANPE